MIENMSGRERWYSALNFKEVDRLPFWPKLTNHYSRFQVEPFRNWDDRKIHDWLGSDKQYFVDSCIRDIRKNTSLEINNNGKEMNIKYITRIGISEFNLIFDSKSFSWHPIKYPIKEADDIKIMTEFYSDYTVEINKVELDKVKTIKKELGDKGVISTFLEGEKGTLPTGPGETPLMNFVQSLAGIDNSHILLFDHKDEVEELFEAIHKVMIQKVKLVNAYHPADLIYFTENTSTTLISPDQFRRYSLANLKEYNNIIDKSKHFSILHMCGHLKDVLRDISGINANAIEALSTPPIGNVRLKDARKDCPDKCLIGGTNAILWTKSPKDIIREIKKELDSLTDHRGIVVTSGGVHPSMCKPETIKEVFNWLKGYKPRF